jgi:hypothetical protein
VWIVEYRGGQVSNFLIPWEKWEYVVLEGRLEQPCPFATNRNLHRLS